jgi:hypothetical protein
MMDHTQYEAVTDTAHILKSSVFAGHMLREEWFAQDEEDQILHDSIVAYLMSEIEHEE